MMKLFDRTGRTCKSLQNSLINSKKAWIGFVQALFFFCTGCFSVTYGERDLKPVWKTIHFYLIFISLSGLLGIKTARQNSETFYWVWSLTSLKFKMINVIIVWLEYVSEVHVVEFVPADSSKKKGTSRLSSLSSIWSYVIWGMDRAFSPEFPREPLSRVDFSLRLYRLFCAQSRTQITERQSA